MGSFCPRAVEAGNTTEAEAEAPMKAKHQSRAKHRGETERPKVARKYRTQFKRRAAMPKRCNAAIGSA